MLITRDKPRTSNQIKMWDRCLILLRLLVLWRLAVVLFVNFFFYRSTTSTAGGSGSWTAPWASSQRTSCTLPTSSELQQVPRHSLIISIMDHYCGLIHRNGPPGTHPECHWATFSRWPAVYGICWLEEVLHKAVWAGQWVRINMCSRSMITAPVVLFKKMIP